jgi:hypothetical protein
MAAEATTAASAAPGALLRTANPKRTAATSRRRPGFLTQSMVLVVLALADTLM